MNPEEPPLTKRKIAFFGGSFDPPHLGHLAIARALQQALALDTVLFAPVGTQPLKPGGASASFAERVAMTRLAIADEPRFALSLVDAPGKSSRPNYSYDTLTKLAAELGSGAQIYCLIGADSLVHLRLWHRAAELPFLATFVIAARPGFALDNLAAYFPAELALDAPLVATEPNGIALLTGSVRNASDERAAFHLLPALDYEMSATTVRNLLLRGDLAACQQLLPAAVLGFLRARKLYCAETPANSR